MNVYFILYVSRGPKHHWDGYQECWLLVARKAYSPELRLMRKKIVSRDKFTELSRLHKEQPTERTCFAFPPNVKKKHETLSQL